MMLFKHIEDILRSCDAEYPHVPQTELYNEGWMLRLTLDLFASNPVRNEPYRLAVPPECCWYCGALLPTAFRAASRGDSRAESRTQADAVIGHFDIGRYAKADLTVREDARHLVVIEAKMFSGLSPGVRNAPYFNQAARTVACIAETLRQTNRPPQEFKALGFYVLAPAAQVHQCVFRDALDKDSLHAVVKRRVAEYKGRQDAWYREWFVPVLDRLDIDAIRWEEAIDFLTGHCPDAALLSRFYTRCLEFNGPRKTPRGGSRRPPRPRMSP